MTPLLNLLLARTLKLRQLTLPLLRFPPVYAQAIHMGEPEEKAPTLQTTPAGSLCAVSDRIPLSRRATVRLGVQIPASVRLLTRRGH